MPVVCICLQYVVVILLQERGTQTLLIRWKVGSFF